MLLKNYLSSINSSHFIIPLEPPADKLCPFNFTAANTELSAELINDTHAFSAYINRQLNTTNCRYGIGGYNELRTVYARSRHFDDKEEPRRLHLGTDIWGDAGTVVFAPLAGTVHSFQYNDHFGDYGATIILQHQVEDFVFHTLYGHLDLKSIETLKEGSFVQSGQVLAHFGSPEENGNWPPHLHFQIILDMEGRKGDYPGVCKYSEQIKYLANCPDPDSILRLNYYIKADSLPASL